MHVCFEGFCGGGWRRKCSAARTRAVNVKECSKAIAQQFVSVNIFGKGRQPWKRTTNWISVAAMKKRHTSDKICVFEKCRKVLQMSSFDKHFLCSSYEFSTSSGECFR